MVLRTRSSDSARRALRGRAGGGRRPPRSRSTAGAGHWTWQSPLPQGGWVSGTSFIGDEGWAVTGGADVLHTTDGGATWTDQPTGESDSLYAVHFVSALEGWAAGDWGAILHTTDGGATWERQVSSTLDTLTDIQFVDDDHGWMIGMASVLATTDGGATWTRQLGSAIFADWYWYGPNMMFTAGAFADAQHGCVVGARALQRQEEDYAGCAWSTSDGGADLDADGRRRRDGARRGHDPRRRLLGGRRRQRDRAQRRRHGLGA